MFVRGRHRLREEVSEGLHIRPGSIMFTIQPRKTLGALYWTQVYWCLAKDGPGQKICSVFIELSFIYFTILQKETSLDHTVDSHG